MASKEELEAMGIKSNNVIICENCYEENEITRTTCKNCGAKLYKNNINIKNVKEEFDDETENDIKDNNYYNENKIALAIKVIAIISFILGILASLLLLTLIDSGIIVIIGIVATIISSVFIYSLGEIVQKLQNIEDNTKKIQESRMKI